MKKKTTLKLLSVAGAATLLTLAAPLSASAHVTVTPDSTAAASNSILTFAFSHGCDGSATTEFAITVPDSVQSFTPTVNPGWDVMSSGNVVTYTAHEPLADGLRTTFDLQVRLPELPAGEVIAFPTLQTCGLESVNWAEVPSNGEEPDSPAPTIVLTEVGGASDGHSHGSNAGHSEAESSSMEDGAEDTTAESDDAAESGATANNNAGYAANGDILARVLGIAGLVAGAVGIVIGLTGRRKAVK